MRRRLLWLFPLVLLAQRPIPVNNEWARVVVASSRPGPKGSLHKHDNNRVMVYLDEGVQRLEFQDGPAKDIKFRAGEPLWDSKGGMHTSQNVGAGVFRVVEIELKKEGGETKWPAADPVKVAPELYKVEMDNPQVRVLRVKLGARQKIAEHDHALPRVIIPLTEVQIEMTAPDGTKVTLTGKPGDAVFAQPAKHREENLRDQPAEVLIVEFKG